MLEMLTAPITIPTWLFGVGAGALVAWTFEAAEVMRLRRVNDDVTTRYAALLDQLGAGADM